MDEERFQDELRLFKGKFPLSFPIYTMAQEELGARTDLPMCPTFSRGWKNGATTSLSAWLNYANGLGCLVRTPAMVGAAIFS